MTGLERKRTISGEFGGGRRASGGQCVQREDVEEFVPLERVEVAPRD